MRGGSLYMERVMTVPSALQRTEVKEATSPSRMPSNVDFQPDPKREQRASESRRVSSLAVTENPVHRSEADATPESRIIRPQAEPKTGEARSREESAPWRQNSRMMQSGTRKKSY